MDFTYLEIILATIISLILFHLLGIVSRKIHRLPPGPFPLPIIGNILSLGDQPHKSLAKLSQIYGPIMSLQLGQVTTVVITSPTLAREVLQKQDLAFSNRFIPNAVHAFDYYKYSLGWLPVGPRFRTLRKIMNTNMFSASKLDANQHLRMSKIQELIEYCNRYSQTGESLHIGLAIFRTTLNLISSTIFSRDLADPVLDSNKDEHFKGLISSIFREIGRPNLVDLFPVLEKFDPQGIKRRLSGYYGEMLEVIGGLIDERLKHRKSLDGTKYDDMLDVLIDVSEENPEDLDRKHMEILCVDLFNAATDTTTNTIEWAMSEIIKNPRVMKKTQEELSQVIGRGKPIQENDIVHLPYLACVVKESFRLHPVAPLLIPRKVEQNVEVSGYVVPKGSRVLVNAWAIGRDPNVWEDSMEFKPERFWGSEMDVRGQHFELIPFGGGRRVCPGLPLAYRMVPVLLGSLLNSFDWKLENGMKPEELDMEDKYSLTVQRARPLRVVAIPLEK